LGDKMEEKERVIARLRRIEGQLRGLTRMVEAEEECEDILTQLMAARSALDQAALQVISRYMSHCVPDILAGEDGAQVRLRLQRVLELMMRMR
jgi:DNA-binding FrmR family transcriptional regulator